jgi:hypothetical protein
LVASCRSNPSALSSRRGTEAMPALSSSTSTGRRFSCQRAANSLTEARRAVSRERNSTAAAGCAWRIAAIARSARAASRAASTTRAPARASASAAS